MAITQIKNFLKRNDTVFGLYRLLKFSRQIPLKDYISFKKLILFVKVFPHTQSNYARLSNAYELAKRVEESAIQGDFVECGVWRGGVSATMATAAKDFKSDRKIWLFDSFEGMPEASHLDEEDASQLALNRFGGRLIPIGSNVACIDDVKNFLFTKLRLDPENIILKKGWFQDTLPIYKYQIDSISILRIDADFYESINICLTNLFDKVIKGGYIIIDDYNSLKGCKKAVDQFIKDRGMDFDLQDIDHAGVYFQK